MSRVQLAGYQQHGIRAGRDGGRRGPRRAESLGQRGRQRPVRLKDVVHHGVAPAARCFVDDPQSGLLPGKLGNIPRLPINDLFVAGILQRAPGRGTYRFPFDQQLQAGPARVIPAADQKVDVFPFDPKWRGDQFARLPVSIEVGIDETFAEVTGHAVLVCIGQRRSISHRLANDLPVPVVPTLEVCDEDVILGRLVLGGSHIDSIGREARAVA